MFRYEDFESSGNPILIENESPDLPLPIINGMSIYGGSTQKVIKGVQLLRNDISKKNTVKGLTIDLHDCHVNFYGKLVDDGSPNRPVLEVLLDLNSLKGKTLSIVTDDSKLYFVFRAKYNTGKIDCALKELTVDDTVVEVMLRLFYRIGMPVFGTMVNEEHTIMVCESKYKTLPWEQYTGGKTSPSIELPSDILNHGDVTTTGKNLLPFIPGTKNDIYSVNYNGIYIYKKTNIDLPRYDIYALGTNNSGTESGYKSFDLLSPGTYYATSNTSDKRVHFYVVVWRNGTSNILFDSYNENNGKNQNFTIQKGDKLRLFLRIDVGFSGLVKPMICRTQSDFNTYEPYSNGIPSIIRGQGHIDIKISGKNLFDYKKSTSTSQITFVDNGFVVGGSVPNRIVQTPVNFKKNESYAINYKEKCLLGKENVNCYLNSSYLINNQAAQQYGIIKNNPFTPNNNYNYFGIYHSLEHATTCKSEITDICLVKSGIDTSYEPYREPLYFSINIPNGLPGLQVTKNGTYTDPTGQHWICDEIDYKHNKYIQRVKQDTLNENSTFTIDLTTPHNHSVLVDVTMIQDASNLSQLHENPILCNKLNKTIDNIYSNDAVSCGYTNQGNFIRVRLPLIAGTTHDEIKQYLKKNPIDFVYVLKNPIERDLTPEEISAYKSMITYNDTTVISNDSNCHMKINYTKGVIMPKYDSTKLIVQMKALARTEAMPIDSTEVWDSLAEAQGYIKEANAYAGQTIKALVNGKYKTYTLQPSHGGYTLEEVGAVSQSDLKQYVQVVERLPESGQQQGVIYIVGTTGQIWTGASWKVVFKEVSAQVDQLSSKVTKLEGDVAKKAPISNPVFTGKVMIGGDEVAVKSYVDGLISNIVSSAPGVVDGDHPLPVDGYKAGQTWRIALAGTYVGQKCEVGDLIICVKDFNTKLNNTDFMVVQANIDGAVTSTAATSTVGEIVVFNAATGKVIQGSGVNISSLNDAISKSHTHANKAILDSFSKNQTQLLADAATAAQGKVDALKTEVDKKANKSTTLAGYGIGDAYTKAEIDGKLKPISDNLNTKVDAATVDSKIKTAKGEIETAYNKAITEKLAARVGSIPEGTDIKTYVDNAVGSGGSASAEAIAKAKQEAITASKQYTDTQLTVTEF